MAKLVFKREREREKREERKRRERCPHHVRLNKITPSPACRQFQKFPGEAHALNRTQDALGPWLAGNPDGVTPS